MSRALSGRSSTWEMSAAAVAQFASPVQALAFEDVYIAAQPLGEESLLARSMALSGVDDLRKLKSLLSGLATQYPGRTLRIPVYFPEPEFLKLFRNVGFELDSLSQFQMELSL